MSHFIASTSHMMVPTIALRSILIFFFFKFKFNIIIKKLNTNVTMNNNMYDSNYNIFDGKK